MNEKKYSKKILTFKNLKKKIIVIIIKKINKIAHSYNLLRISFFRQCVKEDVVAAVFMFELILFQIFGPRNGILFCPLIFLQRAISNAIFDLVLQLFSEGINISFRQDSAIRFQYLKTVVEVHSSTLRSTGSQFIFLKWDGLYEHEAGAPSKNICICFEKFAIQFLRPYSGEDTMICIHSQSEVYKSITQQSSR